MNEFGAAREIGVSIAAFGRSTIDPGVTRLSTSSPKHHGPDGEDNLALACVRCNLAKSSNLSGIDSNTGDIVALFNPRMQLWDEHFAFDGARIVGLTPAGRTTVDALNLNEDERLRLRTAILAGGELD